MILFDPLFANVIRILIQTTENIFKYREFDKQIIRLKIIFFFGFVVFFCWHTFHLRLNSKTVRFDELSKLQIIRQVISIRSSTVDQSSIVINHTIQSRVVKICKAGIKERSRLRLRWQAFLFIYWRVVIIRFNCIIYDGNNYCRYHKIIKIYIRFGITNCVTFRRLRSFDDLKRLKNTKTI